MRNISSMEARVACQAEVNAVCVHAQLLNRASVSLSPTIASGVACAPLGPSRRSSRPTPTGASPSSSMGFRTTTQGTRCVCSQGSSCVRKILGVHKEVCTQGTRCVLLSTVRYVYHDVKVGSIVLPLPRLYLLAM